MSETKKRILDEYQLRMHRFGRFSSSLVVLTLLAVPLITTLLSGVPVNVALTAKGFIGIFSFMGVLTFVEFFSYAPLVGASSLYLCFITGNTINMKLPAALSGVKIAGVEQGSKEAEVVSLISVAVSSLTTVVILTLGMIGISFLLPIMKSPVLKPGFDNLMPALMGALAAPLVFKDKTALKTISIPALLAAVITLGLGFAAIAQLQSLLLPVFMVVAVSWRYFLYRREERKKTPIKA